MHYVIEDLNGEENFGTFYDKFQKTIQTAEFRVKKIIKR